MSYLFGFLLFLICIQVFAWGAVTWRILQLRGKLEVSGGVVNEEEVGQAYRRVLIPNIEELSEFGFAKFCWLRYSEGFSKDEVGIYACVMYHPGERTYVLLSLQSDLSVGREVQVTFITYLRDGEILETMNGGKHCLLADVTGYHIEDPYVAELSQHWRAHLHRLEQSSVERLEKTPKCVVDTGDAFYKAYIQELLAQKVLKLASPNTQCVQYTLAGALRSQKIAKTGAERLQKSMQSAPRHAPSLDYQVAAHMRIDSSLTGQESTGWLGKALLLLFSLGAFMLSFGFRMDAPILLILVAVLFLHELGHLLAMKVCGFRDLQILFIPFLGAAARGDKDQVPAWQKVIVDLMGPAPGLILGIALCFYLPIDAPDWMTRAVFMLIVLNYFNLAPVQPLDGGQLWNLLFFRRWPMVQFVFFCLSILAFAAFSWWSQEVVLGLVALFWVYLLPNQWRQARLFSHIRRKYPQLSQHDSSSQLAAVYEGVEKLKLPWSGAIAYQQVNELMLRLKEKPPLAWEILFGLTLYLTLIVGAPAALMQSPQYGDYLKDLIAPWLPEKGMNWDGQIANAKNPRERLSLLIAAGDYYFYSGDEVMAEKYYDLALKETERNGISPEEKIKILYQLAQALFMNTNDKESVSIAYLQEALRLYQKERIQNGELIPDIYELLVECYLFQSDYTSALKNIDGAFANSDIRRNEQRVAQLYMLKGNALSELHRVVEAERAYIQGIKASKSVDFKRTVELRLLEFYLNEDLNDAAIKRLESLLYGPKAFTGYTDGISYNLNLRLAWAYYSKERYIDAEITLRSLLVDMTDAGLGDVSLLPALELLHIVQSAHDPWQAAGTRIWIEQIAENTLDLAPDAYIDSLREQLHFIPKSSRYRRKLAEAGLTSFGVKNASES
ncbi:site-2 protease family protein [Hahella sp. HN01]|uniref:site-2 protease family protein n=1 Tax=Hahella sp. HN01 TaxID=2847262 RepID=UPI001C1EC329|nr:site-2 protease family protein [Hahella sp. HN01]MBU6950939.1 site-2 protease family protein [Hahella sp. HN01]